MSDSDIEIRPLAETDSLADLTALLHRAYARLGSMGLHYTAVDQPLETTERRARSGACFVAAADNELVGTITVRPPKPDRECPWYRLAHVCSAIQFGVRPESQGTGVGSELLFRAEMWAREGGFSELAVDTAEQASHLIEFYARRGYRTVCAIQWPHKAYKSVILSKTLLPGLSREA